MCVWGALRQPQSLGLAKEVGRGHSVGQRSPQLDLSAWPSKHQAEFMQKDAVSELQWGGGRWQQRRPGAASRGAAMLAAGKAQSVSCLMFSMETGSSGLEALSGVDMSTCSSFTRTAMTKEGEAGGPRGQRERARSLGTGGRRTCFLQVGTSGGGGESTFPSGGVSDEKAGGPVARRQAGCVRITGTAPLLPARAHEAGQTARPECSCRLRSERGGRLGSSSGRGHEEDRVVPRASPSDLTLPFCAQVGKRGHV